MPGAETGSLRRSDWQLGRTVEHSFMTALPATGKATIRHSHAVVVDQALGRTA